MIKKKALERCILDIRQFPEKFCENFFRKRWVEILELQKKSQIFNFLYTGGVLRAPKIENENPNMDLRGAIRAALFYLNSGKRCISFTIFSNIFQNFFTNSPIR